VTRGDDYRIGTEGWPGALCTRTCLSGNHFTAILIPYLVPLLIMEKFLNYKLMTEHAESALMPYGIQAMPNTVVLIFRQLLIGM